MWIHDGCDCTGARPRPPRQDDLGTQLRRLLGPGFDSLQQTDRAYSDEGRAARREESRRFQGTNQLRPARRSMNRWKKAATSTSTATFALGTRAGLSISEAADEPSRGADCRRGARSYPTVSPAVS